MIDTLIYSENLFFVYFIMIEHAFSSLTDDRILFCEDHISYKEEVCSGANFIIESITNT